MLKLDKRSARNIIKSLQRGTLRPGAAKHLHCGHDEWIKVQLEILNEINEDNGSAVHFVRGAYGEGKTHFLHYIEEVARDRGWATSHVECRHDKVELDRFETIYPSIVQKLQLSPDQLHRDAESIEDPVRNLLNHWSNKLFQEVGFGIGESIRRPFQAEMRIFEILQERVMTRNFPGDFQRVICAYPRALLQDDINAQNDLISWCKGEERKINIPSMLLSKPGDRVQAPGVDRRLTGAITVRPITNATSLDVFRGLLWLLTMCDYKGLILSIDEVEQIARLRPSVRRDRSFQTLREFVDNTDGDIGLQNFAVYFAATPNMFDDEDYFRSYDALATRIEPVSNETNWYSPVINLGKTALSEKQLYEVATKICKIYGIAYGPDIPSKLPDKRLNELVLAVDSAKYRIAKPRLLCRTVVDQLERIRQGLSFTDIDEYVSIKAKALIRENE